MKQSIIYYSITFEASEKPSKRATKLLAKSEPPERIELLTSVAWHCYDTDDGEGVGLAGARICNSSLVGPIQY